MPPLRLLSQRDALSLAKQAAEDFFGLVVFLQPIITPYPLSEALRIDGYVLIVAGERGRQPWFELRDVMEYEYLYERVFAHYEAAMALTNAPVAGDEEDEEDEPEPVADMPVPAFLPERRARRQAKAH